MRLLILAATLAAVCAHAQNPAADRFDKLSAADQRTMMAKIIASSGESCARASRVMFQGRASNGAALYSVACEKSMDYQVMVSANSTGSTKVLDCAILKKIGSKCWVRY